MHIGEYELGKELHRSAETTAFLASRTGERKKKSYVLKRFLPLSALDCPADAHAEAAAFLEACDLQRRVAGRPGSHWVRIHDSGWVDQEKGEAYSVADCYPRSLRQLIDGRVKFGGDQLYAMVHSILCGLKEFESAAHRPHGALTSGNVLFTSEKYIKRARVRLTDPARPKKDLPPDWNDLGSLIYEAVYFRPYSRAAGWPLRASPEWQKLGPKGEAWREFCSRLLNPGIHASADDVIQAAGALKPPVGNKIARGVGGAALVAATILVFLAWVPATRDWPGVRAIRRAATTAAQPATALWSARRQPVDNQAWQALCTHYARWFGPLVSQLNEKRRILWSQDAHLNKVLREMDEAVTAGVVFDPRLIAGVPTAFLDYLKDNRPLSAQTPQATAGIQTALAVVDQVGIGMNADQWPARTRLVKGMADFRARGWDQSAAYLESVDAAVPCPAAAKPDAAAVDEVLGLVTALEKVEQMWADMQGHSDCDTLAVRLREAQAIAAGGASGAPAFTRLFDVLARAGSGRDEPIPSSPAIERPLAEAPIPVQSDEKTEDQRRKEALARQLAAEREVSLTGSEVIHEVWQEQCAKLLEESGSYEAMQKQSGELRRFLNDLDWLLPLDAPREIGPRISSEEPRINREVWTQREEALRKLLHAALAPGPVPRQAAEQFMQTGVAIQTVQAFDAQRRQLTP